MNSDYRFTKTNKCIDDEHKKFSSTISEIVSTNQITLELDESNNDSSGCDDEVSDYKISEGNAICDENVERLSINYNTIASCIVMRNERKNVIELIPKIVQQNNVDYKKSLDKSITIKPLCGIEFSEQTINSTANIKKKASSTGGVKKKTMHNIEKSEILSDHNEQSNNDVISDDAICSDVLDLVKFGIVKKNQM